MIDFQDKELKYDVFHLINRFKFMYDKERRPLFITKQLDDGTWSCSLDIPEIETIEVEGLASEVKAVNKCAREACLAINKYEDDNDLYDPCCDKSSAKDSIEAFFDDVEYDNEYTYQLCSEVIDLKRARKSLKNKLTDLLSVDEEILAEQGKGLYKISDYVDVMYLVRKKKKNYC